MSTDGDIHMSDFELAMCHIVPSTYRGLEGIVDFHPVHWEDIGGLTEVKLALQQVESEMLLLEMQDKITAFNRGTLFANGLAVSKQ